MMNVNMTPARKNFVEMAQSEFGEGAILSKTDVREFKEKHNLGWPSWFVRSPFKVDRGMYKLPTMDGNLEVEASTIPVETTVAENTTVSLATHATAARVESAEMVTNVIEFPKNASESYVPSKVDGYVKFGHYNDVKTIKKSGNFYPIFITGLSGNGKTMMIEQVHAELK